MIVNPEIISAKQENPDMCRFILTASFFCNNT